MLVTSGLTKLTLSFIKRNWQAIAVIAVIGIIFLRLQIMKSERDDALATISEQRQAALNKAVEVEILKQQGKRAAEAQEKQHIADIQHIGGQYGKVINDDKKAIDNYRTQLSKLLREQSASNNRAMSNDDQNRLAENNGNAATARPLEESAEFYRQAYLGQREYIQTLEQAGAVCASDYNMCYDYVQGEQMRIGVHD